MYTAGCNRYTGRMIFQAPELETVMVKLAQYRE
jgi:hypothetical protein